MRTLRCMTLILALVFAAGPLAAQTNPPPDPGGGAAGRQKELHPTPAHTGWATLVKDTGRDFLAFPKRRSTWVLLGIGAAGALAAHPADAYVERHVVGNSNAEHFFVLGKKLGSTYVQLGTAVGLWGIGRYVIAPAADGTRTNKFSHLGFDLLRAHIVSQTVVQGIKHSARRDRPTGECCAFPSGHAAAAFATAAVLERHLGYRASWPALVGATYVAASRLVDNRHFLSDVIFGAAVGEATGWTIVGRHGRDEYAIRPVPVQGGMMVALTRAGK
jgi:membrane-associated phospholipid phosphatase